jgi:signal transduction histidine kinase
MSSTAGDVGARLGRILAWGSLLISTGLFLGAIYLVVTLPAAVPADKRPGLAGLIFSVVALAFSLLGTYLATRQETNRVAWIACGIGLGINVAGIGQFYPLAAQYSPPGRYPGARLAEYAGGLGWTTAIVLMLIFLPLLFPDGRLLSPRWKPIPWAAGVLMGLFALRDAMLVLNPGLRAPANVLFAIGTPGLLLLFFLAIGSLVVRYRRAGSIERLQMKWFLAAASFVGVVVSVFGLVIGVLHVAVPLSDLVTGVAYLCFPIAIAIAVLKYRLYEIDLIIDRALVYGALAVFITLVYVAVVVGVGALIRSRGQFSLALSIVATALVAVAFQPVKRRIERLANQLVYGNRSTPYEALSEFSHRVASAYADEEVLPRLARVLVEGTGASVASVWIHRAGDPIAAATWPEGQPPLPAAVANRVVHVRHEGELLGELAVSKRRGEPFTPVEEALLTDLASQAGQVLRNVRLTAELQARLRHIAAQAVELRASRQRIVAAQDAERRTLERNIHDGAQQHLVALAVKLRLAATLAKKDPEKARRSLSELQVQTDDALKTLRDLAQGIYPPALREHGLAEALRPYAAVSASGLGRYNPEVEAAVYFCCLEALQNAAKHAGASNVRIELQQRDGRLHFSVLDDGVGFDPATATASSGLQNMKDRVASVGGSLTVDSRRGRGTTVFGDLPIAVAVEAS